MSGTDRPSSHEQHDVIVIGAGQVGLSAGYHLRELGLDFVILERDARVGDVWRDRYDSLLLYSPARYDALPGMAFPGDPLAFPTGRQMADYLDAYAERFALPVRTGVTVDRLASDGAGGYRVTAGDTTYSASRVIVATGAFQCPRVPDFASELDPAIVQLHSSAYRSPDQLPEGPTLVVGVSHSGADIAHELAASRTTYLSGRSRGQLPFRIDGPIARATWPLMRALATNVLSLDTPIGRRMAPKVRAGGGPLLRYRRRDLRDAGIRWSEARTVGVTDGRPTLADGQVLDVASIVWATGFRPDYGWIELPVLGDDGWPAQERGVIAATPGLYILGMPFLHAFASMLIVGAGRDAKHVVDHLSAAGAVRGAPAAVAA